MNTLSSNMGKVGASDPAFKQMMGSLSNTGKVDVTSIINSADTYAGAAPEDIVKMKPYAIKEAMSNNAISSDTAKRTLESPAAAGMDPQIYEQLQKYAKENEKAQEQPLTAAAVQNNPAINSVNSASQAPQADNIWNKRDCWLIENKFLNQKSSPSTIPNPCFRNNSKS